MFSFGDQDGLTIIHPNIIDVKIDITECANCNALLYYRSFSPGIIWPNVKKPIDI